MFFQHTSTYGAPPDEVYDMLTDPEWREKVSVAQGVVSADVTVTALDSGDGCRIVVDQVQDTAGLPAIAKKIAGETTRAVVTEVWASRTSGTIEIVAPGKPTKAVGTLSLVADDAGTRHEIELDITVKVPLVGGKLEQLMADNISKGLEVEQAVGVAWLEGDR